jgi:hypothetical protein
VTRFIHALRNRPLTSSHVSQIPQNRLARCRSFWHDGQKTIQSQREVLDFAAPEFRKKFGLTVPQTSNMQEGARPCEQEQTERTESKAFEFLCALLFNLSDLICCEIHGSAGASPSRMNQVCLMP